MYLCKKLYNQSFQLFQATLVICFPEKNLTFSKSLFTLQTYGVHVCRLDDNLELKTKIEELIAENEALTVKSKELIKENEELIAKNEELIAKNQALKAKLGVSTPPLLIAQPPKPS
ncbi:MAG TPA: hypothetical protein V6D43_02215 [Candidatus Sericytochromatia bacterium]